MKKSDCAAPLMLRQMLPGPAAEDVPIDARVVLSVSGWGTVEDFEISIRPEGGDVVEGVQDGWCYQHEADWEIHCTLIFQPKASLSANTFYEVRAEPTSTHLGDGTDVIEGTFTTGEDPVVPTKLGPTLTIDNFGDRPKDGVEVCDWEGTQQYDMIVTWSLKLDVEFSVLQVYEVSDDGSEENVHTVFPWQGEDIDSDFGKEAGMEFRQVMDPAWAKDFPNCYRVELEDAAGNPGPSSDTVCWGMEDTGVEKKISKPKKDTGQPEDTGKPKDTGEETKKPGDTGVGSDSGGADDSSPVEDTDSWETKQPVTDVGSSCQCGSGPLAAGWPLLAVALWAVMVRRG